MAPVRAVGTKKRQKRLTTGEVRAHLAVVHGAEVSRQSLSTLIDKPWTAWPSGRTGPSPLPAMPLRCDARQRASLGCGWLKLRRTVRALEAAGIRHEPSTSGVSLSQSHSRRFSRSETTRAEAFSDGVFAIAVTLLALNLADPPHRPGGLGQALLAQWPAYLGYLASFGYVSVIWLNHHQAFVRIRTMDRGLHAANLFLLLTTAALSFPTAVVADALQADPTGSDARVAVALYAGLAAAMCLSWVAFYQQIARRPELLDPDVEDTYVRHGQLRSWTGAVAYIVAGLLGVFVAPLLAIAVFVMLPVFYFVTSEGLPGGRDGSSDAGPHGDEGGRGGAV